MRSRISARLADSRPSDVSSFSLLTPAWLPAKRNAWICSTDSLTVSPKSTMRPASLASRCRLLAHARHHQHGAADGAGDRRARSGRSPSTRCRAGRATRPGLRLAARTVDRVGDKPEALRHRLSGGVQLRAAPSRLPCRALPTPCARSRHSRPRTVRSRCRRYRSPLPSDSLLCSCQAARNGASAARKRRLNWS